MSSIEDRKIRAAKVAAIQPADTANKNERNVFLDCVNQDLTSDENKSMGMANKILTSLILPDIPSDTDSNPKLRIMMPAAKQRTIGLRNAPSLLNPPNHMARTGKMRITRTCKISEIKGRLISTHIIRI